MFPSVSLEEQRLGWPALWSVNHTPVSRKEIFRACSLLPSPSIHPSIHESLHQTQGGPRHPKLSADAAFLPLGGVLAFTSHYSALFPAAAAAATCSRGKPLAKPALAS